MRLAILALAAGLSLASVAAAHPGHAPVDPSDPYQKGELPPAYAGGGRAIAFYNPPNRHGVAIPKTPTVVGKVTLDLRAPADVLVQFTSGIAAETGEGCPCSRVPAGRRRSANHHQADQCGRAHGGASKYEHDRQPADGSCVFPLPAGKHEISLVLIRSMAPTGPSLLRTCRRSTPGSVPMVNDSATPTRCCRRFFASGARRGISKRELARLMCCRPLIGMTEARQRRIEVIEFAVG